MTTTSKETKMAKTTLKIAYEHEYEDSTEQLHTVPVYALPAGKSARDVAADLRLTLVSVAALRAAIDSGAVVAYVEVCGNLSALVR
jgi:hypothetical protein